MKGSVFKATGLRKEDMVQYLYDFVLCFSVKVIYMKKVAILVNEDTMQRCSCGGCLRALFEKKDSFARYGDEELELVGMTHSGGDLAKKIETLRKKGVDVVHLSTCTKSKNENYGAIADACAEYFDVVGYTHGSPDGKGKGKMAVELSARHPKTTEE